MTSYPIAASLASHINDRILVASPSPSVRRRVFDSLQPPAFRFEQVAGGAEALVHLENGPWKKIFLDRRLLDLNAEELSETVRQRFPEIEVVLLDADGGAETALIEEQPARDTTPTVPYCETTSDQAVSDPLGTPVPILEAPSLKSTPWQTCLPGMIGSSLAMQPVYRLARLVAPRNTTVLITGPTGCGKEVVARAVHQMSPRAGRPFAVVNCAAIPETMLEAELFGYARGAFTGALQSYAGKIQAAQGGTLFLDEIGDLPLSLQPKLLRFLEQKELQRLGSSEVVRVDARVISATNAHLLSLVREGKFREDLFYRLSAFPVEIPPLRDRSEDIAPLVAHFIEKFASRLPAAEISSSALQLLVARSWAGNIRELQNVIERALILAESRSENRAVIFPEDLLPVETRLRDSNSR
jgi:DNA-binding NtrC family response regulator